jgi:hypothetical protein
MHLSCERNVLNTGTSNADHGALQQKKSEKKLARLDEKGYHISYNKTSGRQFRGSKGVLSFIFQRSLT